MSVFCLFAVHIPQSIRAVMFVALVLSAGSLFAEGKTFWREGGVVVCESTWAIRQAAASDDSGGVFVVWYDKRGENGSIRAQHVDRDGNTVWQHNGVFVGDGHPRRINQLSALSEAQGGLIAVWQENDNLGTGERHQVKAQHLDAAGTVLWDSSGVVVVGADSGFRYEVATVSDGRGGAIVAWTAVAGSPAGLDSLVVQRIDSLGNLCWGNSGLVLATDCEVMWPPYMCADSAGGACITWDGSKSDRQTIVQHVDSAGRLTWPGAGVLPFTSHLTPSDITQMSGGYIIAGLSMADINAQRIDDHGQLLWGPDGSDVYHGTSNGIGYARVIAGLDGSSSAVWSEERGEPIIRLYAQLLSGSGERQWDSLGVAVGTTDDNDSYFFGCVEAGGGLIASWSRNSGGATLKDIYAQQVDTTGRLLWGEPGLGVATDTGMQGWDPCVVTDERRGAIITWGYTYYGGHIGLSVQRVGDVTGVDGPGPATVVRSTIQARPNPARHAVEVSLPRLARSVVVADVLGRVVRVLSVSEGDRGATWDLSDENGSRVPAGVYVFRQPDNGTSLGRVVVMNP